MPHQLTYVLLLPAQRAVRFDRAGLLHRLQQIVVELESLEVRFLEADKLLSQFLQRQIFALLRAFAGL